MFVFAADPLSAAGAKAELMWQPSVELLSPADVDRASVALVVTDAVDDSVARVARALKRDGRDHPRVVVVASHFEEAAVVAAVAEGVVAFLRRPDASSAELVRLIGEVDAGVCALPESLKRLALETVGSAAVASQDAGRRPSAAIEVADWSCADGPGQPAVDGRREEGLEATACGQQLSVRERDVLRLMADGYDTAEVAEQLSYSESTIKGVLAKVMVRLGARNRCHAVAIATREGLI